MTQDYYSELFLSKCKKLDIGVGDILVSFQPNKNDVTPPKEINEFIRGLLIKYDLSGLIIIEQTYHHDKLYNMAYYLNNYHPHILIKNPVGKDYDEFKNELCSHFNSDDLDEIEIYDLEELLDYLSKQVHIKKEIIYSVNKAKMPLPVAEISEVLINEVICENSSQEYLKYVPEPTFIGRTQIKTLNKGLKKQFNTINSILRGFYLKAFQIIGFLKSFVKKIRLGARSP